MKKTHNQLPQEDAPLLETIHYLPSVSILDAFPTSDSQRATPDELMQLAGEKAFGNDVFSEQNTPFFWLAEISSTRRDAYFTSMDVTSLRNFANESAAGVSFLNSHRHGQLAIGYSLTGKLESIEFEQVDSQNNMVAKPGYRVLADFYTIPDYEIQGYNTNTLIRGIQTGLNRDVSVGFYGGKWICSICEKEYHSYWWSDDFCPHIAGAIYEIEGEDGVLRNVVAEVSIFDAHLSEVSAVYDGATPNAVIVKAEQMANRGVLDRGVIQQVEKRFRLKLDDPKRVWLGANLKGEKSMESQLLPLINQSLDAAIGESDDKQSARDAQMANLATAMNISQGRLNRLMTGPWGGGSDPEHIFSPMSLSREQLLSMAESLSVEPQKVIRAAKADGWEQPVAETDNEPSVPDSSGSQNETDDLAIVTLNEPIRQRLIKLGCRESDTDAQIIDTVIKRCTDLNAQVEKLRDKARDGELAREEKLQRGICEGIRAGIFETQECGYKALENLSLSELNSRTAAYCEIAERRFGGGRKTVDTTDEPAVKEEPSTTPDSAFLSR